MFALGSRRVFLATEAIDMRLGVHRLSSWVEASGTDGLEPFSGDLFVFLSRDARRVKVLVWDTSGYWLCAKRLESGRFSRPVPMVGQSGRATIALSQAQLGMLLEGISVHAATYRTHTGR